MALFSFASKRKVSSIDLEIRFHKEANYFGEHGTIVVSHVKQNLRESPVRFVFVGITTPPKLDLRLMTYIWEEARAQGYVPHALATYGKDNEIDTEMQAAISNAKGGSIGLTSEAS